MFRPYSISLVWFLGVFFFSQLPGLQCFILFGWKCHIAFYHFMHTPNSSIQTMFSRKNMRVIECFITIESIAIHNVDVLRVLLMHKPYLQYTVYSKGNRIKSNSCLYIRTAFKTPSIEIRWTGGLKKRTFDGTKKSISNIFSQKKSKIFFGWKSFSSFGCEREKENL